MPNVFLIGRPGCGKSVVYRILKEELREEGYEGDLKRIDDFPILKKIFEEDTEHERHRPAEEGEGVEVIDDTVWDDLSKSLSEQAEELQSPDKLLFIEFSRDNYVRAFKHFSPEVLEDSIIVYIDCPFEICWERNVKRWEKEEGLDAHLVSKEEMRKTYAKDDHEELPKHVDVPVLYVKNDYSGLDKLRGELRKVVKNLKKQYFD
ncbi:hypothetical protein AKJ42_02865 [candidate division MSBL1 archaeon SCGC-AAA261C02]|uniref:NadR/Ttd14 AAA domain-containing protein n=1 Tax=candidate division MSBL1 archaeon SCGC-AAA261C02 TaxID=1698272 RepID=A0A133UZI7_9EURY|nr:hypothetical protein AKJ42_02865 [candidate division MSBL1 archaeon SCGC-AAA261C02]